MTNSVEGEVKELFSSQESPIGKLDQKYKIIYNDKVFSKGDNAKVVLSFLAPMIAGWVMGGPWGFIARIAGWALGTVAGDRISHKVSEWILASKLHAIHEAEDKAHEVASEP